MIFVNAEQKKRKLLLQHTQFPSIHCVYLTFANVHRQMKKNVHWNKIEKKINSAALIRMEWIHKYINVEFHHQTSSMVHRNP